MADWTPWHRSRALAIVATLLTAACGARLDGTSATGTSAATVATSSVSRNPDDTAVAIGATSSCQSGASATTATDTPLDPIVSAPMDITLVPHPSPEPGVYQAGVPVTLCWGGVGIMVGPLAACSLSQPTCDVRSRWMPGVMAKAGARVTLTIADLNALVSIRVDSVATGEIVVDLPRQAGTPAFDAPSEPGDYLLGIDLTGSARTLSYVEFVRVTTADTSRGGSAMTFPVNAAPQSQDPSGGSAATPAAQPAAEPAAAPPATTTARR